MSTRAAFGWAKLQACRHEASFYFACQARALTPWLSAAPEGRTLLGCRAADAWLYALYCRFSRAHYDGASLYWPIPGLNYYFYYLRYRQLAAIV